MVPTSPILNKRCKVLYRAYGKDRKVNERFGVVSGFDGQFLYLENLTAIPLYQVFRVEVLNE